MDPLAIFPNDATGDALRRLQKAGDDFRESRQVDFCFIFPARSQAIDFARVLDDKAIEVCISYLERKLMWEVIVKAHMIPSYQEITNRESFLTEKAASFDGRADGWGCIAIPRS